MTKDDDLVKRLRLKRERCHDLSGVYYTEDEDCQAAADRIEALTEQLKAARLDAKEAEAYSVWLEGKLAKAVASLETLEDASRFFGSDTQTDREGVRYAHETTRRLCRATLAEIEGDKP